MRAMIHDAVKGPPLHALSSTALTPLAVSQFVVPLVALWGCGCTLIGPPSQAYPDLLRDLELAPCPV